MATSAVVKQRFDSMGLRPRTVQLWAIESIGRFSAAPAPRLYPCQGSSLAKTTAKQRISNAFDRLTFTIGCYTPWAAMGGPT